MLSPFFKKKESVNQVLEQERSEEADSRVEVPSMAERTEPARGQEADGQNGSMAGNKAHLDKKALDLVFAVEQMIQAKQHVETSNQELQDRLTYANGQIERHTRDIKSLNKVVEEREKSILDLEHKLTGKNLKVDQMMEDYRELQATLSSEIEELKSVIEVEQQKYASLLQKHNEAQAEKNKRIGELEEKIGKLDIEHTHLKMKFEQLRQEKTYLVNIVNDFTNRMASPFAPNMGETASSSE